MNLKLIKIFLFQKSEARDLVIVEKMDNIVHYSFNCLFLTVHDEKEHFLSVTIMSSLIYEVLIWYSLFSPQLLISNIQFLRTELKTFIKYFLFRFFLWFPIIFSLNSSWISDMSWKIMKQVIIYFVSQFSAFNFSSMPWQRGLEYPHTAEG